MEIIRNGNMDVIFDGANEKSVLEIAITICSQAKTLAPSPGKTGTGRLRNAIMYKNNKTKGGFNDSGMEQADKEITTGSMKKNEMAVGFNLEYGIYQEFGTRYMKPQPFLRPAIALMKGAPMADIIKKIHAEELRGKLRPGQKRETFV